MAARRAVDLRGMKKSELLAREIVAEIAERGAQPGDVLDSETAMVERYGVGRATIREALRLLETQGLVRLRPGPGGGPVVAYADPVNLGRTASLFFSFNGSTYGELGEALLVVDPWFAELAATHPDRDRVRAQMAPYLGERYSGDAPAQRSAHFRDFHKAVRHLSTNTVLNLWGEVVGVLFGNHIQSAIDFSAMHEHVADCHIEIAATIVAGKAAKARRLMLDHTREILEFCDVASPGFAKQKIEWR